MLLLGVFDIDGTLIPWKTHKYVWEFIISNSLLNAWNKNQYNQYQQNMISYLAWHENLFRKLSDLGATRSMLIEAMKRECNTSAINITSVTGLINRFKYKAVLSGGISLSLEAAGYPGKLFDIMLCHELSFHPNGSINSWNVNPYGSDADKIDGIKLLISRFGVNASNTLYVGDGDNDLAVINWLNREGGLAIALPPIAYKTSDLFAPSLVAENLSNVAKIIDATYHPVCKTTIRQVP